MNVKSQLIVAPQMKRAFSFPFQWRIWDLESKGAKILFVMTEQWPMGGEESFPKKTSEFDKSSSCLDF
jgi:hypothetical protein